MVSNGFDPYNFQYQQSSAQSYPGYQSASSNPAQSRHQLQQPFTTPGTEYVSYHSSAFSGQDNGYGQDQSDSWNNGNYCGSRETTSRAAEVLHNMSNTTYSANSAVTAKKPGFASTGVGNIHTSQYVSGSSRSLQIQAQKSLPSQPAYSRLHSQPHDPNTKRAQTKESRTLPSPSVTAGHQSQRTNARYHEQEQRIASTAQLHHDSPTLIPTRSAAGNTSLSQPNNQYDQDRLPQVNQLHVAQNNSNAPCDCAGSNMITNSPASIPPPAPAMTVAGTQSVQSNTTVDPMAVYNPWPGYQRKQTALLAQKSKGNAKQADGLRGVEEAKKTEEHTKEAEHLKQDDAETARHSELTRKAHGQEVARAEAPEITESSGATGAELESEMRAMMAKMRELNSKDSALLARIWEEERRIKAPKSPVIQKPMSRRPEAPKTAPASTMLAANSGKKTIPRESVISSPKPTNPTPVPTLSAKPPVQIVSAPSTGSTIWPADKKGTLAKAAATYLKVHNPHCTMDTQGILQVLDSNPSYIELCQQLEQTGLKLDRSGFAKTLLAAVPDANSASRKTVELRAPQPPMNQSPAPPTIPREDITPAASPSSNRTSVVLLHSSTSVPPVPAPAVTPEMIPIKSESRPSVNKEEAARKRNLSELIDLTCLSDEDDTKPPLKKGRNDVQLSAGHKQSPFQNVTAAVQLPPVANFPTARTAIHPAHFTTPIAVQSALSELRHQQYVQPLERRKAWRRNNYNPATIARDILLACGRHPTERQLNQHLDTLRTTLPKITHESDLSTIRWDLIDPGNPPPGYFKASLQAMTETAKSEDSDIEDTEMRTSSQLIGGNSPSGVRVQPLPEAINPFKPKRRGRLPQPFSPGNPTTPPPQRMTSTAQMDASSARSTPSAGIGYRAFSAATQYDADGNPLPKKRGRPVGWRKSIHGSAAAKAQSSPNGQFNSVTTQRQSDPNSLHATKTGKDKAIMIDSRSPSVADRGPRYRSYTCKWQGCSAELHNLETLQKHVFKVHRRVTADHTLECAWVSCGETVSSHDPTSGMMTEQYILHCFDLESNWRAHIQQAHIDPLSWELGDGPASGLSDAVDSDIYLSDSQGRQITPRIVIDPDRLEAIVSRVLQQEEGSRGRGRPTKNAPEQEAWNTLDGLVAQKKRIGGPGMDRGGATLVSDKRRRGLVDPSEADEELVDVEA